MDWRLSLAISCLVRSPSFLAITLRQNENIFKAGPSPSTVFADRPRAWMIPETLAASEYDPPSPRDAAVELASSALEGCTLIYFWCLCNNLLPTTLRGQQPGSGY